MNITFVKSKFSTIFLLVNFVLNKWFNELNILINDPSISLPKFNVFKFINYDLDSFVVVFMKSIEYLKKNLSRKSSKILHEISNTCIVAKFKIHKNKK